MFAVTLESLLPVEDHLYIQIATRQKGNRDQSVHFNCVKHCRIYTEQRQLP